MEGSGRVRVFVRMRVATKAEEEVGLIPGLRPDEITQAGCVIDSSSMLAGDSLDQFPSVDEPPHEYVFDKVFTAEATQKEVFTEVGYPVLQEFLNGINGTIMAYGQTGSGKTYSLLQPNNKETDTPGGMLPQLVTRLFELISEDSAHVYNVETSSMQVYNEQVTDLDIKGGGQSLHVKDGGHVTGLTWTRCTSPDDMLDTFNKARKQILYAETSMNKASSRSHAVFQIGLTKHARMRDRGGNQHVECITARLCVVDLAGSERVHKSGVEGLHFKEATANNLSLLALGNVISALATKNAYVPIRDSKLTRILDGSLGRNCKTTLLVCVSPAAQNAQETMSSLEFASRAMQIEVDARINRCLVNVYTHAFLPMYKDASGNSASSVEGTDAAERERQWQKHVEEIEASRCELEQQVEKLQTELAEALERANVAEENLRIACGEPEPTALANSHPPDTKLAHKSADLRRAEARAAGADARAQAMEARAIAAERVAFNWQQRALAAEGGRQAKRRDRSEDKFPKDQQHSYDKAIRTAIPDPTVPYARRRDRSEDKFPKDQQHSYDKAIRTAIPDPTVPYARRRPISAGNKEKKRPHSAEKRRPHSADVPRTTGSISPDGQHADAALQRLLEDAVSKEAQLRQELIRGLNTIRQEKGIRAISLDHHKVPVIDSGPLESRPALEARLLQSHASYQAAVAEVASSPERVPERVPERADLKSYSRASRERSGSPRQVDNNKTDIKKPDLKKADSGKRDADIKVDTKVETETDTKKLDLPRVEIPPRSEVHKTDARRADAKAVKPDVSKSSVHDSLRIETHRVDSGKDIHRGNHNKTKSGGANSPDVSTADVNRNEADIDTHTREDSKKVTPWKSDNNSAQLQKLALAFKSASKLSTARESDLLEAHAELAKRLGFAGLEHSLSTPDIRAASLRSPNSPSTPHRSGHRRTKSPAPPNSIGNHRNAPLAASPSREDPDEASGSSAIQGPVRTLPGQKLEEAVPPRRMRSASQSLSSSSRWLPGRPITTN